MIKMNQNLGHICKNCAYAFACTNPKFYLPYLFNNCMHTHYSKTNLESSLTRLKYTNKKKHSEMYC